jgi:hypothetical protein
MTMTQATLGIEGGVVDLGPSGISWVPWFTRRAVHIPRRNVMFVSPTPGVRHEASEWRTFLGEPLSQDTVGKQVAFYSLEVALHNRHNLLEGRGFFVTRWLQAGMWVKPLFTAQDTPHPSQGSIKFYLRKRWTRKHGAEVMAALETIKTHASFGLIVHE